MQTIELKNYNVKELSSSEMINFGGGGVPWGLIGRAALRIGVGALGVGTGAVIVIGAGILAYEVYQALK